MQPPVVGLFMAVHGRNSLDIRALFAENPSVAHSALTERVIPLRRDGNMKYVHLDGLDLESYSLFRAMSQRFANLFKNHLIPIGALKKMLAGSNSPLVAESTLRPGGWRAMEIIYRNDEPVNFNDQMAVRYAPFSVGLRNRKRIVTRRLSDLIRRHSAEAPVVILGVGAGPGRNLLEGMAGAREVETRGICIDFDDEAFDYGRALQKELDLDGRVEYIKGDARQIKQHLNATPHILKLIGLLEYLSDDEFPEMIAALCEVLAPGGSVITHSIQDSFNNTKFLRKAFGWEVVFRTPEDVVGVLEKAGFTDFEATPEPIGVYTIITAQLKT